MPEHCFYHHICHWCSKRGNNEHLKKCSRCRLVSYCCVEHQKLDWLIHKEFCKAVVKLKTKYSICLFDFNSSKSEEWHQYRMKVMHSVELMLRRKLAICEAQMILFPNVCNVCFKYNSDYYCCSNCQCAYYCCAEHAVEDSSKHRSVCEEFRLCFELDLYSKHQEISLDCSTINTERFPSDMTDLLSNTSNYYESSFNSHVLSFILTLLYALMQSKHDVLELTELNIHLLGCDEHENRMIESFNLFFSWLPHVKLVKLLMIGPDCDPSSQILQQVADVNRMVVKRLQNLYHNYYYTKEFEYPHIVVAFNCGFCEFIDTAEDTWHETIELIMGFNNVLLINTSYTENEAVNDFARLTSVMDPCSEIIIRCSRNPFRSLRPVRDSEHHTLFYLNHFISLVLVRAKRKYN